MTFTEDEVNEIAIMALGRISVSMFQAGHNGDWLELRDGSEIGYGELANMFGDALDKEIRERA